MSELITVWATNYAFTSGIKAWEGRVVSEGVFSPTQGLSCLHNSVRTKEWHYTREEATAEADRMRLQRIASLKKQIAKLEAMRFE